MRQIHWILSGALDRAVRWKWIVLNPADQERADREWVPQALEAGLRRFAIVMPESELAAGHIRERLDKVPQTAMEIAYFASVEEAREWLTKQ